MIKYNPNGKTIIILSNNKCVFGSIIDNLPTIMDPNSAQDIIVSSDLIKDTNEKKQLFQIKLPNNITYNIEQISTHNINALDFYNKIDLLIVNEQVTKILIPIFKINFLINCTKQNINAQELQLEQPFRLYDLLHLMIKYINSSDIFFCINKKWIYNARLAQILYLEQRIKLTDKENKLLQYLLAATNFAATKEQLLCTVWDYHQFSESATVETHLYKLKQKLPLGLLEVRNLHCYLNIESLD
ncbi:MAG: helix-turn-helix domain-containing protein [Rickettsiaceae bacterium]